MFKNNSLIDRMTIVASAFSECGPNRQENEDSIYCNSNLGLFIVADGMGGLADGKYASSFAIEIFVNQFIRSSGHPSIRLRDALDEAHRSLYDESRARNIRSGTTFTAAILSENIIDFIHVGDSALWHLQPADNLFTILTREDTVERDYLRQGQTIEYASRYKNVLTQAVGLTRYLSPQIGQITIELKERLVVCSDGLSGCVAPFELLNFARSHPLISQIAEKVKILAIERLPKDNFSAIVLGVE